MNLEKVISIELKRLRKIQGFSQEELAQRANIDTRHYQRLESAEKLATLPTLFKLATALSSDPDELIRPAWTLYKKKPIN